MFRELGKLFGEMVGSVLGVPVAIIAETLGVTKEMVQSALDAGCETYEEIRDFLK